VVVLRRFRPEEEQGPALLHRLQENERRKKEDCFPSPLINDTLHTPAGVRIVTTGGMKRCYWQVGLHPGNKEKATFSLGQGNNHRSREAEICKGMIEIKSFLSQYIYYRRFISGFADIAKRPNKLTVNTSFQCTPELEAALQTLMEKFCIAPIILAYQ
jgi:hypothetical protein